MPRDENCRKCALGELVQTTCVWGNRIKDGERTFSYSRRADVMLVGEAPGGQEDDQGSPFVGPSGQLLFSTLKRLGLPENYYVTNLVKCFPRGKPSSTHVAACKDYLKEELEHVRPRFILALGNTAWHFFGSGPITEHAGREVYLERYAASCMPCLHPAAILRDPNRRSAWERDLSRFVRLVNGELVRGDKPPVRVTLVKDLRDASAMINDLQQADAFAFDFEATPIPWWHKDWYPLSLAFSTDGQHSWVWPLSHPDNTYFNNRQQQAVLDTLKPLMTATTPIKIAHNMLYDALAWLRLAGELPHVSFDTMVAAHLLDENRPKGLKYLGRALLGWPEWDIDARKEHPLAELAEYNGYDSGATLLLWRRLEDELRASNRLQTYFQRLELPKLRALCRLVSRGVHVDQLTLRERINRATEQRALVAQQLPIDKPASTKQVAA